jgi:hypothetical protein
MRWGSANTLEELDHAVDLIDAHSQSWALIHGIIAEPLEPCGDFQKILRVRRHRSNLGWLAALFEAIEPFADNLVRELSAAQVVDFGGLLESALQVGWET